MSQDDQAGAHLDHITEAEIEPETEVSPQQLRLELGEFFKGPLPPASELEAYANIPGAFDMIHEIAMAPFELSKQALTQDYDLRKQEATDEKDIVARGQHYGLTIALSGLLVALVLGLAVSAWAAAVITAVDLVGLASVPVRNKIRERRKASQAEPHSDPGQVDESDTD